MVGYNTPDTMQYADRSVKVAHEKNHRTPVKLMGVRAAGIGGIDPHLQIYG